MTVEQLKAELDKYPDGFDVYFVDRPLRYAIDCVAITGTRGGTFIELCALKPAELAGRVQAEAKREAAECLAEKLRAEAKREAMLKS